MVPRLTNPFMCGARFEGAGAIPRDPMHLKLGLLFASLLAVSSTAAAMPLGATDASGTCIGYYKQDPRTGEAACTGICYQSTQDAYLCFNDTGSGPGSAAAVQDGSPSAAMAWECIGVYSEDPQTGADRCTGICYNSPRQFYVCL